MNSFNYSPIKYGKLYEACFSNDTEKVWQRIYGGDNIDGQGSDCMSPLSIASFFNYHVLTKELIVMGAQVNNKDKEWLTPLHYAALHDSFECVKLLLESNGDPCCRDKLWQTPLHYATKHKNTASLELIASRCKSLNITDRIGWSALHAAAYHNSLPAVKFLIEKGISVKLLDKKDRSALHYAALKGHIAIVEYLIQQGCLINLKDRKGFTALHFAAIKAKSEVCELLIKNSALADCGTRNGNLPLHFACLKGDVRTINVLFNHIDPNILYLNNNGQSFLHISCVSNESSSFINNFISDKTISTADKQGRYPIHYLAYVGNVTGFQALKEFNIDINIKDNYGWTPLHISCAQSHKDFVNILIMKGADLECLTNDKRTCLHLAACIAEENLCPYLIYNGCIKYNKDELNRTPLHYAILHKCIGSINALIDDNLIKEPDCDGRSAIHYAIYVNMVSFVERLVNGGISINVKDNILRTPLHFAAYYNSDGIILKLLLDHNCEITADSEGYYPLHYAVYGQHQNNVRLLLEKGGITENKNLSTLHLALYKEDEEILCLLLEYYKKEKFPLPTDSSGSSPIFIAASMGNFKALSLLLEHFNNVNIHEPDNIYGYTPLHMAANSGVLDCVKLIFDYKAFPCDPNCRSKKGLTPLLVALMSSKADQIIRYLVKKGANMNAISDMNSLSSIHIACIRGYDALLEFFLKSDAANVDGKSKSGKTPIIFACQNGHLPCVKSLVKNNANIYLLDNKDFGVLHWACYKDKPDIVNYLLTDMDRCKLSYGNTFTPLHCAVKSKSIDCVNSLLKCSNENIDSKDKYMKTALHWSAEQDEQEITELIINSGACLYEQDINGQTPMHIAAANPSETIIESFINCDKLNIPDKNGNTPLHIACLSKNVCSALAFLEKMNIEEQNLRNNEGLTPLNIAEMYELEDVINKIAKLS